MSKQVQLDDALGKAQSLLQALYLAAGNTIDQQDGIALQVVASTAMDSLQQARELIDDILESEFGPATGREPDFTIIEKGGRISKGWRE
ncbi:MAG: hypothetical protein KUA43_18100 [Hoeflea sp.]|uniref:hypothetical protein n=1 Tax=Hoeflea sp. TaxID=1940281 RepID=UPI001DA37A3B|nr:hypothetical protein [Hoeflea sp.]MBU4529190.1 hypothetical protein [Alphaproteobacteria bacterium]MBU4543594.1 hypothetical protein [Alphaproteobacteria bacterium]MBU4549220.1 hypothetical protein [Alphaproteobacteria bacterium]MBV1725353.1 hypothetical protein [Hoeflea sp.]MBV1785316.1 hypothetical protein [Hoeflea sp.]